MNEKTSGNVPYGLEVMRENWKSKDMGITNVNK